MTLNDHNNTIKGFSSQNPMKKRYYAYTCSLFDFEMTKSHESNIRNGLPSQNHGNEVLQLFLASFVEKSY